MTAGYAEAAHNLGVLLQENGRTEESKRCYRVAVDDNHLDAMNNLGSLYHLGRLGEAVRCLRLVALAQPFEHPARPARRGRAVPAAGG